MDELGPKYQFCFQRGVGDSRTANPKLPHAAEPEAEVQREEPSLMSVREKQGPGFLVDVEMSHTTQTKCCHTR